MLNLGLVGRRAAVKPGRSGLNGGGRLDTFGVGNFGGGRGVM